MGKSWEPSTSCTRMLAGTLTAPRISLPQTIKTHLRHTYNLSVLYSGLSVLPRRPAHTASISTFQNKIMCGFLHLSQTSPISALYFLLGELPIEGRLHLDVMSLFYSMWTNPDTTAFKLVQYIMKMVDAKSTTWVSILILRLSILILSLSIPILSLSILILSVSILILSVSLLILSVSILILSDIINLVHSTHYTLQCRLTGLYLKEMYSFHNFHNTETGYWAIHI